MKVIIVGNGVAGITVAKNLREISQEIEIEIFSWENYPYYPRPALIDFLSDRVKLEEIYFYPQDWYEKNRIKVNLGILIKSLDQKNKSILTEQNQTITYDRLVLAVGASAFIPDFSGKDRPGVFSLRTLRDALAIKEYLQKFSQPKIVVIGGGVLGLEVAAALGNRAGSVTVIENGSYLLPRQLDKTGAEILTDWLKQKNVTVLTGKTVREISGLAEVEKVSFTDGTDIAANSVIVATGIRSEILLAKSAGLTVNKGIVVNEYLQTAAEDVFAAGDCAEFKGIVYGIIPAAQEQAKVVAANIIQPGSKKYNGTIPSNSLKIVGLALTTFGKFQEDKTDQVFRQAIPEKNIYKKLVVSPEGRIQGGIWLGDRKNLLDILNSTQNGKKFSDEEITRIIS